MKKRHVFVVAVVLLIGGVVAKTMWEQAQIDKIVRMKSAERPATPKCDTPLVISTNGNTWHLQGMSVVTVRGEDDSIKDYFLDRCDKGPLTDGVYYFKWIKDDVLTPGVSNRVFITIFPSLEHKGGFQYSKEKYLTEGYDPNLKTDMFSIDRGHSETFIFSPNAIKTRDQIPVAFGCDSSLSAKERGEVDSLYFKRCGTTYQHPDGFVLSYRFSRESMGKKFQNLPKTFPEIDRKVREYLETQMVK